jgi:hypothetical protein
VPRGQNEVANAEGANFKLVKEFDFYLFSFYRLLNRNFVYFCPLKNWKRGIQAQIAWLFPKATINFNNNGKKETG